MEQPTDAPTRGQSQAIKWINAKWKKGGDTPCPMCDSIDWEISSAVFMPLYRLDSATGITVSRIGEPDRGFPFVPVTCSTCGNTVFLPLNPLGGAFPGVSAEPGE